jgi:hypothetical protein
MNQYGYSSLWTSGNHKLEISTEYAPEWRVLGLALAPYKLSGRNICPWASKGCIESCLHTAGAAIWQGGKDKARIARTRHFFADRRGFLRRLSDSIGRIYAREKKKGRGLAVRLNVTSDITWPESLYQRHKGVVFYGYTKSRGFKKLQALCARNSNVHLTISATETWNKNKAAIERAIDAGFNVAIVFESRKKGGRYQLPKSWLGFPCIDGSEHDLRFIDPPGHIIALPALGKAKRDKTGFVVREWQ